VRHGLDLSQGALWKRPASNQSKSHSKVDQTRREAGLLSLTIEYAHGFAYVDNAFGMSMALAVPKLLAALPFSLLDLSTGTRA